jgi:hypothetical protein
MSKSNALPDDEKWTIAELIEHIKADWPTYDAIELMDSYAKDVDDSFLVDPAIFKPVFERARDAFQTAQDTLLDELAALALLEQKASSTATASEGIRDE